MESAGEALGDTRAFLMGLLDLVALVFWIFFGGLPSEEEDDDELDESLELDRVRSKK